MICCKSRMPAPQTHDYTNRGWGHDYIFNPVDGGLRGKISGFGVGIREGDFLILQNKGDTTRYRVESIKYCSDPKDMWHAEVVFAPR